MASLRRGKLILGSSTGLLPHSIGGDGVAQFGAPPANQDAGANQVKAHPISSPEKQNEEIVNSSSGSDLLIPVGSCSLKDQNDEADENYSNSQKQQLDQPPPAEQAKPKRKRIRRKPSEPIIPRKKHKNEKLELFSLTGVYYKNHSWQAAIKVDKKQIHLGTHKSQVEAAHAYDRAAFMCKRKLNYELPMEEKEELVKLNWNEFLEKTKLDRKLKKRMKRLQEARAQYGYLGVPAFRNNLVQGAEGASSSEVAKEQLS